MTRTAVLLSLLMLLAIGSVTATYTRLSRIGDEGFHMLCGLQWWQEGKYNKDLRHPPFGRIVAVVPVLLAGIQDKADPARGLTQRDAYIEKTALARLGVLPFYLLSVWLVFAWSRQLFGDGAALWSVASYITLPPVAAHAGLVTTDMPYTAMFLWAMLAGIAWLRLPGAKESLWLGISAGLMVGTKFSGLFQWPVAMALVATAMAFSNRRQGLPASPLTKTHALHGAGIALPLALLVIALLYRFSLGEFIGGLEVLKAANDRGAAYWLFGPLNHHAVWYFFPVVFFFKTPLAFQCMAAIGNAMLRHGAVERWFPLLAALGVLLISMTGNINLGVRHILPVYPLLAIPAGYALWRLWQAGKAWLVILLAASQLGGFALAYPEYLAYFNFLAGSRPEQVAGDSDFDWGQGVILLDEALQAKGIKEFYLCLTHKKINVWNERILLRSRALPCPRGPVTGWLAVSRTAGYDFSWLRGDETVQSVSKTLDLYYIPGNSEER